jgi:hypothetical protein
LALFACACVCVQSFERDESLQDAGDGVLEH